ncbi:unnamed protein product, partial [marine sediment metagenome]
GTGSEKMKGFAAVSGKSVGEFEKLWKKDASEALLLFIEGLGGLKGKGIEASTVLKGLGMDGIRMVKALLGAAKAGDKFRGAIDLATKSWIENTALSKEAALRYKTAASQLKMATERARQMAVSFGAILVPAILKVVKFLEPIVDWLTKLSPTTKMVIVVVATLAAAIGPLLIALGLMASGIAVITAIGAP